MTKISETDWHVSCVACMVPYIYDDKGTLVPDCEHPYSKPNQLVVCDKQNHVMRGFNKESVIDDLVSRGFEVSND